MVHHPTLRKAKLRSLLLPAALGGMSVIAAGSLTLRPPQSGPVAVLFPPWWPAERSMAAAAGGAVIRFGAFPFVVVVMPEQATSAERLRRAGAWMLLNPQSLGACATT